MKTSVALPCLALCWCAVSGAMAQEVLKLWECKSKPYYRENTLVEHEQAEGEARLCRRNVHRADAHSIRPRGRTAASGASSFPVATTPWWPSATGVRRRESPVGAGRHGGCAEVPPAQPGILARAREGPPGRRPKSVEGLARAGLPVRHRPKPRRTSRLLRGRSLGDGGQPLEERRCRREPVVRRSPLRGDEPLRGEHEVGGGEEAVLPEDDPRRAGTEQVAGPGRRRDAAGLPGARLRRRDVPRRGIHALRPEALRSGSPRRNAPFSKGGHGFGLGRKADGTDQWLPLFVAWLGRL